VTEQVDTSMEIEVTIEVDGADLGEEEALVVDMYGELIETFIRKNRDYGDSYVRSAAIMCYYRHGKITDELLLECIAEQVFVRMLDKQSRFHELMLEGGPSNGGAVDDERIDDTLLDWANYCVMLAAQARMYADDEYEFASEYKDKTGVDVEGLV